MAASAAARPTVLDHLETEMAKNSDLNTLSRHMGDDACPVCEGWGWRFPRRDDPDKEPMLDGEIHYQAQPCAACGRTGVAGE